MEWELWAYLFPIVSPTLPPLVGVADPPSWLPWASLSFMPTDQPSPGAHNGGSGPSGFMLCGRLHENTLTEVLALHWAWGLDLRSSQGKVHRGWEGQRVSLLTQHTAPLFWDLVLRLGRASA